MSEHQCYEFFAVDRALTSKQIDELRAVSTRAEITPTRFWNEYHWGDLKADAAKLMDRYFDAHLYFANWGTHRLMLRVPLARVDHDALRPYFVGRSARASVASGHLILDLSSEDEDRDSYYQASRGSLAGLVPLRTELMRGDLRVTCLVWLVAVGAGDVAEKDIEPPVPPGLSTLTEAQAAMVEFLRIDEDLIAAAAEKRAVVRLPERDLADAILHRAAPLLQPLGPTPPIDEVRRAIEVAINPWNAHVTASKFCGDPRPASEQTGTADEVRDYAACFRRYSRLPGTSRSRRRSTSIAAVCTFRPDSHRDKVFCPRWSSFARSPCVSSNRSRMARISAAERSPCFLR
ncbi:MAG TPA: hypothetical protein VNO21_09500 [Polyangiaceae bacterium]|nr:hypothetical protein [Polyangiaceae bacterium]